MQLLAPPSGWVGSAHAMAGPEAAEMKKALEEKTKEVEALREQARLPLGTGCAVMHTSVWAVASRQSVPECKQ